jgi:acetolactate synthase-1/2/3 large subunit
MNCSEYLAKLLIKKNILQVFSVTGGGSMFLNEALDKNKKIKVDYFHHEQSAAIAAEGYWRASKKIAAVVVTTGPGCVNTLTGVYGSFVDSIPMLIISGQVRTSTNLRLQKLPLRQLGDQELNTISVVKNFVKYCAMPTDAHQFKLICSKAFKVISEPRFAPVWIDVPIDVQSSNINSKPFSNSKFIDEVYNSNFNYNQKIDNKKLLYKKTKILVNKLENSKKPLILLGTGSRSSGIYDELLKVAKKLSIPICTGWNAHDMVPYNHSCYVGKPGTVGDRPGNFAIYNCDFLLILGCRLNIRQISYNWNSFASRAYKVMVDIDKAELIKKTLKNQLNIHTDLSEFIKIFKVLTKKMILNINHLKFLRFCKKIIRRYPEPVVNIKNTKSFINPYKFFEIFFKKIKNKDIVVVGNGSACVMGFQAYKAKKNQIVFTNSGCAAMGYDIPAAIGANIASKKPVYCITGDGSIMLNLQELALISFKKIPIKIFILNNGGYHSIKQTQKNFFKRKTFGTSKNDGLGFPDFEKIASGFNIKYNKINNLEDMKKSTFYFGVKNTKPEIFEVFVDKKQNFEPKLISWRDKSGKFHTPNLHEMSPLLSRDELNLNIT